MAIRAAVVLHFALTGALAAQAPVWRTDWETAFRLAKEQNRMVFVDYYATTCKPCQAIETQSFLQPEVQARLATFVLLRVDVTRNWVPRAHREYNPPVYLVFDPDERERYRITEENLDALYPSGWGGHPTGAAERFDRFRAIALNFLRAAELLDAKEDLKAHLLMADAYFAVSMKPEARKEYEEARTIAAKAGDDEAVRRARSALEHLQ
jgi:hypothetical protein